MHRAIFLDRDDTLNENPSEGYLNDPEQLRLLPNVVDAVRRINEAGFLAVVITNQGGLGLNLVSQENLDSIHDKLNALLAAGQAHLDAVYYCPYHPDGDPRYADTAPMRKPKPGMLIAAAEALDIELERSWMVGDSLRDVQAGHRAGCRNVLLSQNPLDGVPDGTLRADDLSAAVSLILMTEQQMEEKTAKDENPDVPPDADTISKQLAQIHQEIRKLNRDQQVQDFSYVKIFAGLAQALVFFCLLMAYFAQNDPDAAADAVEIRLIIGGIFQAMALTFYVMNR